MALSSSDQRKYLKEIGIDLWYPRLNLINAPTPLQFNEISTQLSPEPNETPSIVVVTSAEQQAKQDDFPNDRVIATVESQVPVGAVETQIRFAVRLYVVNDCLVVSSLSSDYEVQDRFASRLLNSILKITMSNEITLHHDHLISWPFFSSPNASQGVSAAKKYVNGVIEHLLETYQVKTILAFGGVLAKLNNWSDLSGSLLNVPYLLLPSLYKMLQNPSLKKKAWISISQSNMLNK